MLAPLLAVILLAATGPQSWLDAKPLVNWNTAKKINLPFRPGSADPQLATGGRCAATARPPTAVEDHALTERGWSLVGPYQRFGTTSIVSVMAAADGMCRPLGYQVFAFVDGWYAGSLAPKAMDSRTDGAIASLSIPLYDALNFSVDFSRYTPADPRCCPHSTSTVTYKVKSFAGRPHVVPISVSTQKNPQ